jgi:hypothetical protein
MAEVGRTGLKNQFVNNEVVTKADLDNLIDSGYNVNDDQICYNFSTSKIYRVGNLAIQSGKLCRAKVYVTPGPFNAGQWDCYDLVQNVTSNYSAYNSLLAYAINDTVTQDVRLWKAKSAVPAGQAPPTNSDVENTYWIEVSKSEGGYIATYGSTLMIGGQLCIHQNSLYVVPGTKGQVQTFNGALSPETNGFTPAYKVPGLFGTNVTTKINRNLLPTIASYIFKTGALVTRDSYIAAKPTIHALRSAGCSSVSFQLVNTVNTTTIGAAVSWDGANGTSAAAVSDLNSRITSASLPFDIQTTVVLSSTNGAVENILFLPDLA